MQEANSQTAAKRSPLTPDSESDSSLCRLPDGLSATLGVRRPRKACRAGSWAPDTLDTGKMGTTGLSTCSSAAQHSDLIALAISMACMQTGREAHACLERLGTGLIQQAVAAHLRFFCSACVRRTSCCCQCLCQVWGVTCESVKISGALGSKCGAAWVTEPAFATSARRPLISCTRASTLPGGAMSICNCHTSRLTHTSPGAQGAISKQAMPEKRHNRNSCTDPLWQVTAGIASTLQSAVSYWTDKSLMWMHSSMGGAPWSR